jgi:sulfate adenylyltransferase
MAAIRLAPHEVSDFRLLAWGAYAPLTGFLGESDYHSVVRSMHLDSGDLWSLPITIAPDAAIATELREANEIELLTLTGDAVGLLHDPELYAVEPADEARFVYGTEDPSHPGVATVLAAGPWRLGGRISVTHPLALDLLPPFDRHAASPAAVREIIAQRGWTTVVAFQTRNPIHRAHEYLTKIALEGVDGLLVHPLVGETKADDVPADVRLRCYETLLSAYYPPERTLLALFPAPMRYAGPREAVFHARVRANYGATHLIVGRDHAGVGNYYGPYDAQELLRRLGPSELGIRPLFFDNAFFCRACGQMATSKTCPHPASDRVDLSGTVVRKLLAAGQALPAEYSRPEVARLLIEAYASHNGEHAPGSSIPAGGEGMGRRTT